MHNETTAYWQHSHIFGQDQIKSGERRTLIVIIMTGLMMIGEITAGIMFGSMALTADGIHMGSHMVGLGITYFAYIYSRKHAQDRRFSFGSGKINALAGYSSALILVFIALFMTYESLLRFVNPVKILFTQAITVAVIGLVVNGVSMLILGEKGHSHTRRNHDHIHHDPETHNHHTHVHEDQYHGDHVHTQRGTRDDHNLNAAYLHVLTDALTSILAIIALLAAKYFALVWMDPLMGIVGAIMVIRWSVGLIQGTIKVLLDQQCPDDIRNRITRILENHKDNKVFDMHIWSIGTGIYSAEIGIVTKYPESPNLYKRLIPKEIGIVHANFEVHQCLDKEIEP